MCSLKKKKILSVKALKASTMQLLSWDTKFKHCLDGFVKRLQQKAQEALSQGVIVDAFKGRRVVHLIGETRTENIVKLCSEIERNIFSENP